MTAAEFLAIRHALGLSARALAVTLSEPPGEPVHTRTVYRWERGEWPVPGPVAVAVRAMQSKREGRD